MFGFMRQSSPALPVADAIARVAAGEMILIDVRDHAEIAQTGKARGALHIPLMRLPMMADPRHPDFDQRLAGGKPIALYCASGARSGMAANILQKLGHADTHNLGGLQHWAAAGGAIER
ncbi:MAG: rhodanese-like domain-containing protein [Paracoccaceae bacterium]|jgi:rhodanese-related sulfurtransferase|nr:rhodanese-like domain-containing protein [Paracoccaceae bacterium]